MCIIGLFNAIVNSMIADDSFRHLYCYIILSLPFGFIFTAPKQRPCFSPSDPFYPALPSLLLAHSSPLAMVLFYFPGCFAVTPGSVLTSKDWELGVSDERQRAAFVVLHLCYLTQHDLSVFYPFTCKVCDFIFFKQLNSKYSIVCMHHFFSSPSPVEGSEVVCIPQLLGTEQY